MNLDLIEKLAGLMMALLPKFLSIEALFLFNNSSSIKTLAKIEINS